jgi:hypothetical protein
MSERAEAVLRDLGLVDAERARRQREPVLAEAVAELKAYQQERFRRTYADLLASPEFGPAARFFLDELYGPRDFTERDAQFARVVPGVVRLFGGEISDTVAALAALHALSERLDTRMAERIARPIDAAAYRAAWPLAATADERSLQIMLTLRVGGDLERLTRKPLLRHTLRLMRAPAHAAGLGAVQEFLESGFDTFRAMRDPAAFLACVGDRERALCDALFAGGGLGSDQQAVLGQLP